MRFSDTNLEAERFRTKFLQPLSGTQRAQMAVDMTETAHAIRRNSRPASEYSAEEIQMAFVRLTLGDDLYKAANPTQPLLAP